MKVLYGAVDLHSNNNYAMVSDEKDEVICEKRLPNNLERVNQFFGRYKEGLSEIVIESTYNGYWLMDGLQEKGYRVKLANPAAMKQYSGLKYSDDANDAAWLNHLNRLGILPVGYIYPKEERSLRDILRKRSIFVQKRTSLINSLKHQCLTWKALDVSREMIEKLETEEITKIFEDPFLKQSANSFLEVIRCLTKQIEDIEKSIAQRLKEDPLVSRLRILKGIGPILSWTIRLEIGELDRFNHVKDYVSYCGLVQSLRKSNGKIKGKGNEKNRNVYLRWAYGEAVIASLKDPQIRSYHDRLVRKKSKIKAKAIMAAKMARVSFMIMKDPDFRYDQKRLFGCNQPGKNEKSKDEGKFFAFKCAKSNDLELSQGRGRPEKMRNGLLLRAKNWQEAVSRGCEL